MKVSAKLLLWVGIALLLASSSPGAALGPDAIIGGRYVRTTYQPDIMIRATGETSYVGDNIINSTGAGQTKSQSVVAGTAAVYELRVRNNGTGRDTILITGSAGRSNWSVRYFDALTGGRDITRLVTSRSGWRTPLLASRAFVNIRLEVLPGPTVANGSTATVIVTATSRSRRTQKDVVKAVTTAVGVEPERAYYVSPTGSDANPGTFDRPWATPGYASRQLQPGDTLIILGGRYVLSRFNEDIIMPASGTSSAWITIKGEPGNRPVLVGRDNLFSAIILGGVSYVRVENLEITHDSTVGAPHLFFRGGVDIAGSPSSHIVLKDLYIHHIDEMALNIQDVDDLQILNCRFEYCGFGAIGGPAGDYGGCRNVLIKNCELSYGGHYYQGGDGSDRPYDRPDGFGIEPSDGPIEIADAVAQHNYGDGLDSKCKNTYIHNCIVANNSCDGIKLWGDNSRIVNCLIYGTGDGVGGGSPWAGIVIGEDDQPNAHFEIINVTVHDNPTRHAYPMYVQYDSSTLISLVMRNCIVANGYGMVYIGDSASFTCDHNLFYCPGRAEQVYANGREYTAAQLGLLGPGNISAAPLFVHPAWGTTGDYHLQPGSPGIDMGTSTGAPTVDLEYHPRPQGLGFDMGAYER